MPTGTKNQKQVGRLVAAAQRLAAEGRAQRAVETAVKALAADDTCLPAYLLIARVQLEHGNREPALWAIGEALKLAPASAEALFECARIHRNAGDLDTALSHAERALAIDGGLDCAEAFVIEVLTMRGSDAEARSRLERAIADRPDDIGIGLVFGDWAIRLGRVPEAAERLERHLRAAHRPSPRRRDVLFRLGRLYEHLGEYDRAFAVIREAQQFPSAPWDAEAYDWAVADVCANWSAEFLAQAPRARNESGHLIFVVGMPRSGTTLIEQVLASHPDVAGGGELPHLAASAIAAGGSKQQLIPFQRDTRALTDDTVTKIGAAYLAAIAGAAGDAARVTDKMPANHALLGLVELALPGARVVHCRRDPRDTCLSCYFTDFRQSLAYTHDLGNLGRYARAEQRLMSHWQSVLKLPILTVDYEDVVTDMEGMARQLVEFAGLDWNPDCLRFHESRRFVDTASALQVRQPVYRSSLGRWRNYEKHLAPLLQALRQSDAALSGQQRPPLSPGQ